jgi:hypothetical protein
MDILPCEVQPSWQQSWLEHQHQTFASSKEFRGQGCHQQWERYYTHKIKCQYKKEKSKTKANFFKSASVCLSLI